MAGRGTNRVELRLPVTTDTHDFAVRLEEIKRALTGAVEVRAHATRRLLYVGPLIGKGRLVVERCARYPT